MNIKFPIHVVAYLLIEIVNILVICTYLKVWVVEANFEWVKILELLRFKG